jgi:hypothetical protein
VLLGVLSRDGRTVQLRAEAKELGTLVMALDRVIQAQRAVFDKIEPGKTDRVELGKRQNAVTRGTELVAKKMTSQAPDVRKELLAASETQAQAEKDLADNQPAAAAKQLGEGLRVLLNAKINATQLRTEKEEQILGVLLKDIDKQCDAVIEMQRSILAGTVKLQKEIASRRDKKPTRVDRQVAGQIAQQQKDLVAEIDTIVAELADRGDQVLPVLFRQVRSNLAQAQGRLEKVQVSVSTQRLQKKGITTLELLAKTIKKAQQGIKKPKSSSTALAKRLEEVLGSLKKLEKEQREQILDRLLAHEKVLVDQLLKGVD